MELELLKEHQQMEEKRMQQDERYEDVTPSGETRLAAGVEQASRERHGRSPENRERLDPR